MGTTTFDSIRPERGAEQIRIAATAPTTPAPVVGDVYFNTTDGKLYTYNGSSWKGGQFTTTSTSTTSTSTSTTTSTSTSTSTTSTSTSTTSTSTTSTSTSTT